MIEKNPSNHIGYRNCISIFSITYVYFQSINFAEFQNVILDEPTDRFSQQQVNRMQYSISL